MRTAEAKGEESGFWKVAEAADIYGRWTGGARAAADILTSHVESIAVAAVEVWGAGANVLVSAGNGIPVFGDPLFEEGPESDEIEGEQNGEENGEEGGSDEEEVKKPLTLEDLELELETGSRIRGWPKVPGDEGTTRGVGPGPGPGEAKPTCCIDHFRYPATWFRFSEGAGEIAGSASSHQKVGIALNSEMQFNNARGTCNCV